MDISNSMIQLAFGGSFVASKLYACTVVVRYLEFANWRANIFDHVGELEVVYPMRNARKVGKSH